MFRNKLSIISLICLPLFFAGILLLSQPAHAAAFVVTSTTDAGDNNLGDGVCDDGTGNCTLRAAVEQGNSLGGAHTIRFTGLPGWPGAGAYTINIFSNLIFSASFDIDASSGGTPNVIIDAGTNPMPAGGTTFVMSASNTTIRGFSFLNNQNSILNIYGCCGVPTPISNITIAGNYFGVRPDGTLGGTMNGAIFIGADTGYDINTITIGGNLATDRNVFSGTGANNMISITTSGSGTVSSAITIRNNYIGTNIAGNADGDPGSGAGESGIAIGNNVNGVTIDSNVISGNGAGIIISGDGAGGNPDPRNITIKGNLIGTDAAGSTAIANYSNGIQVHTMDLTGGGSAPYLIGGPLPADRNVISGNGSDGSGAGIYINDSQFDVNEFTIQNNYIGTDAAGNTTLPNTYNGIIIEGDTTEVLLRDNVVSGNGSNSNGWGWGVSVHGDGGAGTDPRNIMLIGNSIGTNALGNAAIANVSSGVNLRYFDISGDANWTPIAVGAWYGADGNWGTGDDTIAGNLISGNGTQGIDMVDVAADPSGAFPGAPSEILILDNRIGTDSAGTSALPNGESGIEVRKQVENTAGSGFGIGEFTGNVISGNSGQGIAIDRGSDYIIENNSIGTDAGHTLNLGNTNFGITMTTDQGGPNTIQNNHIYYNGNGGILGMENYDIAPLMGAGGTITGNTLYRNVDLGVGAMLSTYTITNNVMDDNAGFGLLIFGNTSEDPDFPQIGPPLPTISGNTITNNDDTGFIMVDTITQNYGLLANHGKNLWCANNDNQFDATCPDLGNNVGIHDNTGAQYAQGWFGVLEILFSDSNKTTVTNAYNVSAKFRDALANEYVPDAYSQAATTPVRGVWGHLNDVAANLGLPAFDYHNIYTWPIMYDFTYGNGGAFSAANPYTLEVTTNCGTYTGSEIFQYTFDGDSTNDLLGANPPFDQDFQLPHYIADADPATPDHYQIAQVMSPVCGGSSVPPVTETCSLTPTPINLATDKDGRLEVLTDENGKPYVKLNWGEVKMSDSTADMKIGIFMDYLAQDPDFVKNGKTRKLKTVFAKYLMDRIPQSEFLPALQKTIESDMALAEPLLMTMGIEETYRDYWPYLAAYFAKKNEATNSLLMDAIREFNRGKKGFGDYLLSQLETRVIQKDPKWQAAESCVKGVIKYARERNRALKQGEDDKWIFNMGQPDLMAEKTILPRETESRLRALFSRIVETEGKWLESDLVSLAGDRILRRNILNSALQNPAQSIRKTLEALKKDGRVARLIDFYQTSPEVMELKRVFFGIKEVTDVANCVANPLRAELSQATREIRAETVWNMLEEDEGACNTNAAILMAEAAKGLTGDTAKNAIVGFMSDLLSEESAGRAKALADKVTFTDYYKSRQEQAKQEIIGGLTLEIYRNDKTTPIKTLTSKDPEYANREYMDRGIAANNAPTVASYTYSIASKTKCDTNQNGKKGMAEIYPQIDPGQKIDVMLDYKLKVKEAYDKKFMDKLAELFTPIYNVAPMHELNGQCEAETEAFKATRARLAEKAGAGERKYFLSTDLGDLALQLALCETRDYYIKKVITNQLMGNNLYVSFLGADIAMGQKTTESIVKGILSDAGKKAAEEKVLMGLSRDLPDIAEILRKTMDELTLQDKTAIKTALQGKEYLFKRMSQAADLNIEVCEQNKACKIHPAKMDIFGDGTIDLDELVSGTLYTVKFRLQGKEGKYAAPQAVRIKVSSGLPKADGSGFETKQKVILGDFKACNFDNTNDTIDVNDIRKFKDIIGSAQERDYADIDGRGNFDINDVKQCLLRGTAVEALGLAGFQQAQSGSRNGVIPASANGTLAPAAPQGGEPAWVNVMEKECPAVACVESAFEKYACQEGVALEYGCRDGVKRITASSLCKWGCDGATCCTSDRCRQDYNVGQKCQDSDGGSNPKKKGEVTLTGNLNLVYADQCSGLHAVAEYTCDASAKPKQTIIPCGTDEVCSQSACTPLNKNPLQGGNEICGNGIDDDNDSMVDCFDGQCSPGAGQTFKITDYCTLRTDEAVCCLYWDKKKYEFKSSFQVSDCQGAGRFPVKTKENCTERALAAGLCIGADKVVVPGIGPQACCEGLILVPPPAGIIGINGTCRKP